MADTLSENAVYIPDGRLWGTGLISSNTCTGHGMIIGATLTNVEHALSVFAAPEDKDWVYLCDSEFGSTSCLCYFDVANGVTGSAGSAVKSAGVDGPYRGGYTGGTPLDFYRCWMTFDGTVTSHILAIGPAGSDGNVGFTGDGSTVSVYFWGAQCEVGSRPSSLINTDGATGSRAVDSLTYAGLDGFSQGTVTCKVLSEVSAGTKGTFISLEGATSVLNFYSDDEDHISMESVEG